jgi:hypothetical protein
MKIRPGVLKKRSQKPLQVHTSGDAGANARMEKFVGSLYQKRTTGYLPS